MVPAVTCRPERGSLSGTRYAGSSAGCAGTGISGTVSQDGDDALGADQRAGHLVGRLDRRTDRDDEEEGVAVERDDVADVDRALDREPGAEPGDQHEEDARQQHLGGVQGGLRRRDVDAGPLAARATGCGSGARKAGSPPMPRSTRRPGDGVGAERGQLPGDLALDLLPALQRAQQRAEQQHHRGHADQHDQRRAAPRCAAAAPRRPRTTRSPRRAGR